jgi:hypothetical protein
VADRRHDVAEQVAIRRSLRRDVAEQVAIRRSLRRDVAEQVAIRRSLRRDGAQRRISPSRWSLSDRAREALAHTRVAIPTDAP